MADDADSAKTNDEPDTAPAKSDSVGPARAEPTKPKADDSAAEAQKKKDRRKRQIEAIGLALLAGGFAVGAAFGGAVWGANATGDKVSQQAATQFKKDQRREPYANILQQATKLQNAASFDDSAVAAGVPLDPDVLGKLGQPQADPQSSGGAVYGDAKPYYYNGFYYSGFGNYYSGGTRSSGGVGATSWQ
ncbi:hypothetical protein, partial [Mycolicibacterium llatzerense]|uniref:hypothetical protein n=1 Tax=Mycolicibacterium llatzerense TaxID=280871 RepID=UPI0013A69C14